MADSLYLPLGLQRRANPDIAPSPVLGGEGPGEASARGDAGLHERCSSCLRGELLPPGLPEGHRVPGALSIPRGRWSSCRKPLPARPARSAGQCPGGQPSLPWVAHRAPRGYRRQTGRVGLPGQRGLGRNEREVTLLPPRGPHWQGSRENRRPQLPTCPARPDPRGPEKGKGRGVTGPETFPKPHTHMHACTPRRAHAYTHTHNTQTCSKLQGPAQKWQEERK